MTQAFCSSRRHLTPLLLGAALSLISTGARAWGDEGHRAVGELAFRYLSPGAKAWLAQALTDPGYATLAEAATWPDSYARRFREYDPMKPFHYVNVPATAARYDRDRDCASGCLVTALAEFTSLLEQGALPVSERRRCIYWTAHLMGDIHQPLHLTHPDARGGNGTLVGFFDAPESRSAHWIWDGGLIERRPPPEPAATDGVVDGRSAHESLVDQLTAGLTPQLAKTYRRTTAPEALVNEGLVVARRYAFLRRSDHVDESYERSRWPIVKEQLQKAGVRLAAVLERAFERSAP